MWIPRRSVIRWAVGPAMCLMLGLSVTGAHAQGQPVARAINANIKDRANQVLSLMAYSVVPDVTTSSLSITNTTTGNPGFLVTQFGGGFTVSTSVPLYMEGNLAYSRYDPRFVTTDGQESRELPVRWNSLTATGGIGWDFPVNWITPELKLRPIFNFTLGYIASDANVAQWWINYQKDSELDFLKDGQMGAYGLGGSLMLDYEHYRPEYEIDVEWRYTHVTLRGIDDGNYSFGEGETQSTNLWARWRAPTGYIVMERPLRYVLEFAHSSFFGNQADVLGFDQLTSLGAGIEFDTGSHDIFISRVRFVLRHVFGHNVSGTSLGFAVSF